MKKGLVIICFLLGFIPLNSQNKDSLLNELKTPSHDTTRCKVLLSLIAAETDIEIWPVYNKQVEEIAVSNLKKYKKGEPLYVLFQKHLSSVYGNFAILASEKSEVKKALDYVNKSISILEELLKETSGLLALELKRELASSYVSIGCIYQRTGEIVATLSYFKKALALCEEVAKSTDKKTAMHGKDGIALALMNLAYTHLMKGEFGQAEQYYRRVIETANEILALHEPDLITSAKQNLVTSYMSLGYLGSYMGDTRKALLYLHKSLKISEEIGDKLATANTLNNIATIFATQGDLSSATDYIIKGLCIQKEIGDKRGVALSTRGLGSVYIKKGDRESDSLPRQNLYHISLGFFLQSQNLFKEINAVDHYASVYNEQGILYKRLNRPEKSLECFEKAVTASEHMQNIVQLTTALNSIGAHYYTNKDLDKAKKYIQRAMNLAKEIGYLEGIKGAANTLCFIYETEKNAGKALEMKEIFVMMRDSIFNDQIKKTSAREIIAYQYEKKAVTDSLKQLEERRIVNIKLDQEENQRSLLYGGIGLAFLFACIMMNGIRLNLKQQKLIQRQKKEVEEQQQIAESQRKIIEEKQKEVLDSIHYAKRIQVSLLTTLFYIDKNLTRLQKK
jgi:tetratricopeptide (TPR) repeat protein